MTSTQQLRRPRRVSCRFIRQESKTLGIAHTRSICSAGNSRDLNWMTGFRRNVSTLIIVRLRRQSNADMWPTVKDRKRAHIRRRCPAFRQLAMFRASNTECPRVAKRPANAQKFLLSQRLSKLKPRQPRINNTSLDHGHVDAYSQKSCIKVSTD
jgi:hypothetical protein